MQKDRNQSLANEDRQILDLLAKINEQYETYLQINNIPALPFPEEISKEPLYTWNRPLTLVISKAN